MNAKRRKELTALKDELETIAGKIEDLKSEEQEAFDNIPDTLQFTEKNEKMSHGIDSLQEAYDSVYEAISSVEEVIGE